MLGEGETAPGFALPDQAGNEVTLAGLLDRGRPLVLYFYPRADTPGCTTQACGVRDHRTDYERAAASVVGISPDPVKAVARFADKHSLDFTLLADEDHSVAGAYGTWQEKRMAGRTYWGVVRSTFIVTPDGRVARAFPKVSPKTHDEVVLAALAEL